MSLLTYLDILIGFVLVMLLASAVVTVLSQWLLNLRNYRAMVLKEGLKRLLIQVDGALTHHAEEIARRVLLHPLIAGQDWRGEAREGAVVQREELVRVLLELATGKTTLDGPALAALRTAFGVKETDGDAPKSWLDAIQARTMQLEVERPGAARHVLQARAIVENASTPFVSGLMSWFDETSGRMTQYFAQRARAYTIFLSTLVALALPLDAIDLLRRLSLDETLRSRLAEAAQKMEEAQRTDLRTPASPADAAEVQRLHSDLESLAIVPKGGVWTFVQQGGWKRLGNAMPGILLSICLMSFGAPFWFETLKHLLKLRPALAQKEETDRQERMETQPAAG
jgi:hypothetical protein